MIDYIRNDFIRKFRQSLLLKRRHSALFCILEEKLERYQINFQLQFWFCGYIRISCFEILRTYVLTQIRNHYCNKSGFGSISKMTNNFPSPSVGPWYRHKELQKREDNDKAESFSFAELKKIQVLISKYIKP